MNGGVKALGILPVLFGLLNQKYLHRSLYNNTLTSLILVFSGIRNHNANHKWKYN